MQLVDRTLKALTLLCQFPDGLSVSELSLKLGIPASSTHRILSSLKQNNFIVQDETNKKYKMGYKLFTMCSGQIKSNSLLASARPVMKELSRKIDKTVVLCAMEHDHIINVDCIERKDAAMYMVKIGKEMPLYATSAGRIFSAYMDRKKVLELYSSTERKAETPYTKTSLEELCQELDEIKKQGYALIDEELQMGIQGVACPVLDGGGHVAAALAFTSDKQKETITEEEIQVLKNYAERLSRRIS